MNEPFLCSQCGSPLPADARFCPQCGARVADTVPAAAAAAADAAAGERRQVAILFADLSGYTRLSRTQDPEETHRLLSRFFEHADGVIERMGGTIDKHIGDAVMAVFGAPVAYGNDIERALRAAAAIHEGMGRIETGAGAAVGAHIGIASGEVVAATTGSAVHRGYTVTGDAVNLAARLTDLARSGETVVADDVHRVSSAFADMSPLGSVAIRGLGEPVPAWKVVALHAAQRDGQPLVGRDAERRRFADLVSNAKRDAKGAVVVLRADPGMGKSRLAEALLADARVAGTQCHAATVLDFGEARAHDAVQAVLSSLLGVHQPDPAARDAALRRAIDDGRADPEDEPYLADLLLIPQAAGSMYDAIDAKARWSGKVRAIANVVERAARVSTCVILIEDVHWASEWVIACLQPLADVAARAPLVLVLTTRRDGDPITARWPAERVVRFDLAPLDREEALALARLHLAGAPDIAERCVDRAQGNPLFLMQLLRSDSDEDGVPPTIQSVVLARLDRLAPADKAAMQAASVIGLRFPLDLLQHLVDDVRYVPSTLLARDLLRNDDRDAGFVVFTHALIRDGAYASLLHASRRALHVKAATWYESRDATLNAEHLDRAEDPRAASAYLACARSEAAAMRPERAVALASRGLELTANARTRYATAMLVGELQAELGRATESIGACERAIDSACDDAERARAWIGIALAHRMESNVADGLAALDAAERHAGSAGLVRDRAKIAYLRGSLHFAAGNADACRRHHERSRELALQAGDAECEAQALSGLADALYAQGRLRSAHAAFVRCLEICERLGLVRFSLMNHCMVAIIDAHFGRIDDALARLDRARAIARDIRHRVAETMCDESGGWILCATGRIRDAALRVTRGIPLARSSGARRFLIVLLVADARIRREEGALDEARASLREAWELSDDVGHRFAGPLVLGEMAACAATDDERRGALAQGERLLHDECVSHCYFDLYRAGIETSLTARDWAEAERYAQMLDDYAREEPLPLIDFFVARGRALAAAGRGRADGDKLIACQVQAREWKLPAYLPAVDAAIASSRLAT